MDFIIASRLEQIYRLYNTTKSAICHASSLEVLIYSVQYSMALKNVEISTSYPYNYKEMNSSSPKGTLEQRVNPSDIPNLLPRQEYLRPISAMRPLEINIDPEVHEQYICLEDWKDPAKVLITNDEGEIEEERLYFSAGTVSGKEGVAWQETWQVGVLLRKPGERAYTLQPPVKIEGGKPKIDYFPEGSTTRECAPAVWYDERSKDVKMLMHTDCFKASDIEIFKAPKAIDAPFQYISTLIQGEHDVNYDPEIMFIKNQDGEYEEFMAYVRTPANERYHTIRFSKLVTDNDRVSVQELGIYMDEEDFPHQHHKDDPDSSFLGYEPSFKNDRWDDDPEDEWRPEAPWFEERTLDDGTEVIDGYIVTFRKRIGYDEQDQLEVRRKGTRQRLTRIRIYKNDWTQAIEKATAEAITAQQEGVEPNMVKLPFEILGYVIDPGTTAECGHGSDHIFQRRALLPNGKPGKWQLYEIVDEEDQKDTNLANADGLTQHQIDNIKNNNTKENILFDPSLS